MPPRCSRPTWSQMSSSSRRLCEAMMGVRPLSATSSANRLFTVWRTTGSRPSNVSIARMSRIRAAAYAADDRNLLFHALGERPQLAVCVQTEAVHQLAVARFIEFAVQALVASSFSLPSACCSGKELLIRDEEKPFLHRNVLENVAPSVDLHLGALIRLQNAGQHAQERGLARAVRADQAVDRAVLDFRADV